jgi:hypothetical protein
MNSCWRLTVTKQHKVHVRHRLSGVQKTINHLRERLDDENKASHSDEGSEEQNQDDSQQTRNDEAPPMEGRKLDKL